MDYVLAHRRTSKSRLSVILTTKSRFFDNTDTVIVKIYHDRLEITKPTLDYRGQTLKVYSMSSGWKQVAIVSPDIENGKYFACEERSSEDLLYIKIEN